MMLIYTTSRPLKEARSHTRRGSLVETEPLLVLLVKPVFVLL